MYGSHEENNRPPCSPSWYSDNTLPARCHSLHSALECRGAATIEGFAAMSAEGDGKSKYVNCAIARLKRSMKGDCQGKGGAGEIVSVRLLWETSLPMRVHNVAGC